MSCNEPHIFLDCCPKSITGEDSFKGEYIFTERLVETTAEQICKYSNASKVYRMCKGNLQSGPYWADADLKQCLPNTETTQNLILLSNVILIQLSNLCFHSLKVVCISCRLVYKQFYMQKFTSYERLATNK